MIKRTARVLVWGLAMTMLIGGGWTAWTYGQLLRLRVQVRDACARAEAARVMREALVENLLVAADNDLDRSRVQAALDDPSRQRLTPELLGAQAEFDALIRAELELSRALVRDPAAPEPSVPTLSAPALDPRLQRAAEAWSGGLERVQHGFRGWEARSSSLPGRLIVSATGLDAGWSGTLGPGEDG